MRRSLPVFNAAPDALDLVEIPIPCEVPWSSMPGDEQVRHCGQCKQNVYNVAALTRAEAMRLLQARACLRIYRRPDNTVITSDCRERLRAARKRGLLVFAGVALVVLWAQICAQFVGMMGLKRLLGGGHQTMGAPVPVPGQIAPPPIMGEPPPVRPALDPRESLQGVMVPPGPRKHHRPVVGRIKADPVETKGKLAMPIFDE
jgi:hypothetical protein